MLSFPFNIFCPTQGCKALSPFFEHLYLTSMIRSPGLPAPPKSGPWRHRMGLFERLSACGWFRVSGQKMFRARNFSIPEQSHVCSGQGLQPAGSGAKSATRFGGAGRPSTSKTSPQTLVRTRAPYRQRAECPGAVWCSALSHNLLLSPAVSPA